MQKKLVNKKVVRSIEVGILAFITAAMPVMSVAAEEGDALPGNNGGTAGEQTPGGQVETSGAAAAVVDAQTALNNAENEIPKEKTEGQEQIAGSLEDAKEAIKDIPDDVKKLDELNQTAAGSKADLNDAVTDDENGTMGTMAENVAEAKGAAEAAAESTAQNAEEAEGLAGAAENAQGVTYENSEAAATAKAQAQADADAAEEQERDAAQAKLDGLNGDLKDKTDKQTGLNGKRPGLEEEAEKARENYTKAEGELETASTNAETAAKTATEAAKAADEAETAADTAKTAADNAQTAADEAETAATNAQTAAEDAQKAAEQAKVVADAYKNAQTAQAKADAAYKTWEEIDQAGYDWKDPLGKKKEEAEAAYYEAANAAVSARINCMLKEKGATGITIGNWHNKETEKDKDMDKDNYYLDVSYEIDGVTYWEYYDYDGTDGDITDPVIVKKTPIYKSQGEYKGFTFPLEVSAEDSEVKYKLNGKEVVPESYEGNTASITLPVEIKTYTYGAFSNNKHTLIAATIDGETKYYDEKGNTAEVTYDKNTKTWHVNGVPRVNFELKSTEDTQTTINFVRTKEFNGKGETVPNGLKKDDVTDEAVAVKTQAAAAAKADAEKKAKDAETAKQDANQKAQDATNKKQDAEKKAQDAETARQNADQKAQAAKDANELLEAAKTTAAAAAEKKEAADNALKALNEQIKGLADAISKLNEAIEIADGDLKGKEDAVTDATKKNNAANDLVTTNTNERDAAKTNADAAVAKAAEAGKISGSVQKAYDKVVAAIEALQKLTAEADVDAEEYNKVVVAYENAVSEYEDALTAKGVSASNVARVSAAAQRARVAADGVFAYQTPAASTGGGGGTTGGGTTTETPADSDVPTVELGEDAVPLAGGATTSTKVKKAGGSGAGSIEIVKADGNGTSGGAGIELEDEEIPLAGLEEEDGKGKAETGVVVEDEETPLAAPIEEQSKMSWWWLILIAVLGVTGEEMYRRHRRKVAEEKKLNS